MKKGEYIYRIIIEDEDFYYRQHGFRFYGYFVKEHETNKEDSIPLTKGFWGVTVDEVYEKVKKELKRVRDADLSYSEVAGYFFPKEVGDE